MYHFLYFSNDNKFFLNYFQSHNLAKNILILRVLIRGDFSAIFILYFHLKKKKVYTVLSKFWNYNVYHFLYFSNDNKCFLKYFQSHSLAKKNKKKKILLKKIIDFYHRSEFLQPKKKKKKPNKTKGM